MTAGPAPGHARSISPPRQQASPGTQAGRDLACEALETLASCARLHDLGAAAAAFARALDVAAAENLRVHRLRILNELGTVEMLRDARGERLEQARSEASRAGAVGLAVGIGANIAALMAMTARFEDAMEVASEVERAIPAARPDPAAGGSAAHAGLRPGAPGAAQGDGTLPGRC